MKIFNSPLRENHCSHLVYVSSVFTAFMQTCIKMYYQKHMMWSPCTCECMWLALASLLNIHWASLSTNPHRVIPFFLIATWTSFTIWRNHNSFNQFLSHGHLQDFHVFAKGNIVIHTFPEITRIKYYSYLYFYQEYIYLFIYLPIVMPNIVKF